MWSEEHTCLAKPDLRNSGAAPDAAPDAAAEASATDELCAEDSS